MDFVAIIAILCVFGIPGYIAMRMIELRHERLLGKDKGSKADAAELEGLKEERKLLVSRIENLETIVCSVDYELNEKLNRLVLETSDVRALPEPASTEQETKPAKPGEKPAQGESLAVARTATDIGKSARKPPKLGSELELGSLLAGRYRIHRLLGRGGMGAVYLADDQALDEQVALKVVSSAMALNPREAVERFRREAQAARRIAHDNVIRIHDLGEAGTLLYLSMEYFVGRSLNELLDRVGTMTSEQYRDILIQICDGLAAAHKVGVIHRDLKPGNVLVGERDAVKLIDFGLATSELLKGLTATGQMLGTPSYMSPEQVRGQPVDARSDIYSLGALAYRTITGVAPFEGATPIAVGFAHLMETATPVIERRSDVSKKLSDLIASSLAKDPTHRPQTVGEFKAALTSA